MRREDAKIEVLFDLEKTMAGEYLKKFTYPWEALKGLGELIVELGQNLP
ncbi:MAG: UDP-N-acetylglucosamine pyrophosphorylase, partial [Lachnoanaerobaculum sp.]